MAVSLARAAAFDILERVERDAAFATELLHSKKIDELSIADRGLTQEIVMGVLRWRSALDAAIAAQASQPLRKLDREVLIALRIGAYQLRFLDRVPANAAVNESVELVKRARKRSAVPFANAILRKLTQAAPIAVASDASDAARLAAEFAHPEWMVSRYIAIYGREAAEAICRHDQRTPETAIRLPFDLARRKAVEVELARAGVELAPGALLHVARRVVRGDVRQTQAFARGEVWIQDEASQLVAVLAGNGELILDCCAAPGGKTSVLAERNPSAAIVALELHEQRAKLLRERVKAANVEVRTADVTAIETGGAYDCVLADVPCSGTGTLARNPEIKWRLKADDLADFQRRQVAILRAALGQLARGGRLIYSTCSLEPEEGEAVVEQVAQDDVEVLDCRDEFKKIASEIVVDPEKLVRGKFLRTIPGVLECDGFFAAVLTRR